MKIDSLYSLTFYFLAGVINELLVCFFSRCELGPPLLTSLGACLHGGGGPQVGEVTRQGGVTRLPYNLSFYLDHVYMIGEITRQGGLPGLPGGVTLSAGVTICYVNVSRWGSPPSRGRVNGKKLKS